MLAICNPTRLHEQYTQLPPLLAHSLLTKPELCI